jgi:hypothetical protein
VARGDRHGPDAASRQRPAAPDADLPALTTATLASLQGGLLLAKTAHDSAPLRIALHAAITYLKHPAAAGDEP